MDLELVKALRSEIMKTSGGRAGQKGKLREVSISAPQGTELAEFLLEHLKVLPQVLDLKCEVRVSISGPVDQDVYDWYMRAQWMKHYGNRMLHNEIEVL